MSDPEDENAMGKNDELGSAIKTARIEPTTHTKNNQESNQPFTIKPDEIRSLRSGNDAYKTSKRQTSRSVEGNHWFRLS